MLKNNETTVIHPVFGRIRIKEKFLEVLKLKPFRDLRDKSQLGTKFLGKITLNAKHTRLMHSIGVKYLTEELLDICEKKFLKYFEITTKDKEILKLAALGHDIGHVAFSHSLEDRNMKTHEQRTIEYFEEYANQINDIFGYDIVSKVIQIYKDNIDIKMQGNQFKMEDRLDILFIFTSLLVGTIDCDRMEYITTDKFNVYGERVDYRDIFKYITIVLLNDSPTVGFEKDAVPLIEDMLLTRFMQYEKIYYENDSTLIEIALKEYKDIEGWKEEDIVSKTEYEILTELKQVICNPEEAGTIKRRLAEIILEGNRENIMFKRFENDREYEYFLKKLEATTKRKDIVKTTKKNVTIYNPNKNKVYIKDDDGVIKDIMEVSQKISDISISLSYVMIDLDKVYGIDLAEEKKIKSLFLDNPVEIEKKFVFKENMTSSIEQNCKTVEEILNTIPGVQIKRFDEWDKIENEDLYFESSSQLPKGVAMRYRTTGSEKSYYLKIPADDGTSITKRYENKYYCKSRNEFLELVKCLFNSKGYNIDNIMVTEGVKINTKRYKNLAKVQESVIEIACDFSTYEYAGKKSYGIMLECELKEGDDISLWYLSKHLKNNGFVETNESKETRAKKALGI